MFDDTFVGSIFPQANRGSRVHQQGNGILNGI